MARVPLLSLNAVGLTFGGDPLIAGLDLSVRAGERLALVGRNGSGKSTLMRIIAGITEPDSGSRSLGPGVSIGYLEQEPDFAGFATLGDFAAAGMAPGEEWRVERAAEGLALKSGAAPAEASGGERRRAALARLVAQDPDLMLLDEPTNHLDIAAITWLEDHLLASRAAFIVISHDRAFLRSLGRATLWLDRGILRRQDRGFADFENWRDKVYEDEDIAAHKLDRLIRSEGRWAVEGISARRKRNQGRVRRLEMLRAQRAERIMRQGTARIETESGPKSGRLVVEARGITKSFAGTPVVMPFDLRIRRGERVAIVGPNGSGKTTLIELLLGRIAPDTGGIRLGSGLRIAVLDQNRAALDADATLWDTLTGDNDLGVSGRNDQIMVRGSPRHVVGYLKDFLFDEARARGPVRALSGGEKARLLLAKLLARDCNFLVLDEPTNDLDIETLDLLQERLDEFDGTVLLVSHDRDFLDRTATTTIAMAPGGRAVIYAGGWSDMVAQGGGRFAPQPGPATAPRPKPAPAPPVARAPKKPSGLSFTERHRLGELPTLIDRLEVKIAGLSGILGTPDLFQRDPAKFAAASAGLTQCQQRLGDLEAEWLALEERAESGGK